VRRGHAAPPFFTWQSAGFQSLPTVTACGVTVLPNCDPQAYSSARNSAACIWRAALALHSLCVRRQQQHRQQRYSISCRLRTGCTEQQRAQLHAARGKSSAQVALSGIVSLRAFLSPPPALACVTSLYVVRFSNAPAACRLLRSAASSPPMELSQAAVLALAIAKKVVRLNSLCPEQHSSTAAGAQPAAPSASGTSRRQVSE